MAGRPTRSQDIKCRCDHCAKSYTVPEWQSYGRRFCSRECWYAYRREHKIGRISNYKPTEKQCPRCRKTFLVGGRGRPPLTAKFCSQECSAAALGYQPEPRSMALHECTWVAALIDGEGTIVRTKNGKHSYSIRVGNTCRPLLDRLSEVTGTGAIYEIPQAKAHHKPAWLWQVNTRNAALLLHQLLPWLIVKRDRAEEVLAAFDHTQ